MLWLVTLMEINHATVIVQLKNAIRTIPSNCMHSEFHNFILLNFYILLILMLKIILKINYENETNSNFIENIKVENITSCL